MRLIEAKTIDTLFLPRLNDIFAQIAFLTEAGSLHYEITTVNIDEMGYTIVAYSYGQTGSHHLSR